MITVQMLLTGSICLTPTIPCEVLLCVVSFYNGRRIQLDTVPERLNYYFGSFIFHEISLWIFIVLI